MADENPYAVFLTDRQHATVLAALRLWQEQLASGLIPKPETLTIASNEGRLTPLCEAEIDQLCEELNTAERMEG